MKHNPWSEIDRPSSDLNVRLVDQKLPLKLFWGVDSSGRYVFVVEVALSCVPPKAELPSLKGILVATAASQGIGRLVLLLNDSSNWELFHALCEDITAATATAPDSAYAAKLVIRRLVRWQEFLRKERDRILTAEKIRGLIGELLFMRDILAPIYGWDLSLSFWRGPEGGPQDFAVHDVAVEVKCHSGAAHAAVTITSVDQLNPDLPRAYLVVQTISTAQPDNPDSTTLNALVDQIRSLIARTHPTRIDSFDDLLFREGYIRHDAYDATHFQKIATRSYAIVEGFPRIARPCVPPGIDRVSYRLNLDACSNFEAELNLPPT